MNKNYLIIARHGEGEHNTQHIFNADKTHPNYKDVHLTSLGNHQAYELGRLLLRQKIQIEKAYVSEFPRTQETYAQIQKALGISLGPIIDHRLNEVKKGSFEGVSMKEFPYHNWDNRFAADYGGEGEESVLKRVESFIEDYLLNQSLNNKSYLIITHGTVAKNFFERLMGAPIQLNLCQAGFIPLEKIPYLWSKYPKTLEIQQKIPMDLCYDHGLSFYSYEFIEKFFPQILNQV